MHTQERNKAMAVLAKTGNSVALSNDGLNCVLNLADFPHGEELGRKVDAVNGRETIFYSVPNGITVPAFDETTGTVKHAVVTGWSEHRNIPVEITTLFDKTQVVADDDPRAIYGIPKNSTDLTPRRFTPSEALKQEVFVPVAVKDGTACFEEDADCGYQLVTPYDLNCEEQEHGRVFDAYYDFFTGKVVSEEEYESMCEVSDTDTDVDAEYKDRMRWVQPIDFDMGQFLGCLAGDGWWDRADYPAFYKGVTNRAVKIADDNGCNNSFVGSYIRRFCPANFDLEVRMVRARKEYTPNRYGNTTTWTYIFPGEEILTEALSDLLRGESDESTTGSGNKRLPMWACAASEEFRAGLLAGFISTDGSVSVSKHKKPSATRKNPRKPQLLINGTSTSLLLLRDLAAVARSLDINTTVSFSKVTCKGNCSWAISFSTPDMKRNISMFRGMCHKDKFDLMETFPVSMDSTNKARRRVVVPACVAEVIKKWLHCPKGTNAAQEDTYGKYNEYNEVNTFVTGIYVALKAGYMTEKMAVRLYNYAAAHHMDAFQSAVSGKNYMLDLLSATKTDNPKEKITCTAEQMDAFLEDLQGAMSLQFRQTNPEMHKAFDNMSRKLRYAKSRGYIHADTCSRYIGLMQCRRDAEQFEGLLYEPVFAEWVEKILCGGYSWEKVVSVEKTGKCETLYDLTVPGYETFMSADGVVLSNTINVHVPSSDKAVKEAYDKMMPSKNPFSSRKEDTVVPLPKQEQILGLYTAATAPATHPVVFNTEAEAMQAIRSGKISLSQDIEILNK